ncbi:hypothetical protein [Acerihabitans sp.]|uniref:hypothetical protein n=1 Tax=Acerihabitans sp. TaxID=2811394 RepID=UPI002ED89B78
MVDILIWINIDACLYHYRAARLTRRRGYIFITGNATGGECLTRVIIKLNHILVIELVLCDFIMPLFIGNGTAAWMYGKGKGMDVGRSIVGPVGRRWRGQRETYGAGMGRKGWQPLCRVAVGECRTIKNPKVLNLIGGTIGLLNLGTSKKSSGTYSDCGHKRKFCLR